MRQFSITFQPDRAPIQGQHVTASGLHGLLFHVLQQANPQTAAWLHDHAAPKPFTMAPYYTQAGHLEGLRYTALHEEAAGILYHAWTLAHQSQQQLRLGRYQTFTVREIQLLPTPTFYQLAQESMPAATLTCHFLSPTSFKQGPGDLPLPLPANVFGSLWRTWNAFAPDILHLPETWLDWCAQDIFITAHQIHTVVVPFNRHTDFTGFVGQSTFRARRGSDADRRIWHTLGQLAPFCGVGRKTAMGMGIVACEPTPL